MAFTTSSVSVADLEVGAAVLAYSDAVHGKDFTDLALPDSSGHPTDASGLPTVASVAESPSADDTLAPWTSQATVAGTAYTVILQAAGTDLVTGQSPLVIVVDSEAVFVTATD